MNNVDIARECMQKTNPGCLEYDEWLNVGMVAKDVGVTFAEWDAWSSRDKRYKPKEMKSKWDSFKGGGIGTVGMGTLVKLCRDQGGSIDTRPEQDEGHELSWDAVIGPREVTQVVRQEWLQDLPLPPEPVSGWDGKADFAAYIRAIYDSEDLVGYVTTSFEADGKFMPSRGVWDRTAGQLLEALTRAPDLSHVIGDWKEPVGAWIRFNPLNGQGCSDKDVTHFRFALVESDDISVERQHAIYQELELPIAALVHSGGKSLHAIVRIEATDFKEYQNRVDFLYDVCKKNGLAIDRKNRNPSRLSRLPGVTRNGNPQRLVATNIGKASWAEWADWIAAQNDDLPEVETASNYLSNLPPLADCLIDGVLRQGHKMLLSGPSKAGKSFLMLELTIAIAEGLSWLGWTCNRGRVLYVNLELDRASCYHRIAGVYQAMNITPTHAEDIDVWNLRGKAMPMTELAPRLIRRALKRKYSAIIIDPIYKVITGDENAADQMAKFCNQFDRLCAELGAAVIYCHHHSKGDQGQKRASDRASGSGVFARDPDALIDLIELDVTDAIRAQYVNRNEANAISDMLDMDGSAWRKECPQDDQAVADKLAKWAEANGLGDLVRASRPQAREKANMASGWRIEGILREFRTFEPRQIWFDYPIHRIDSDGILEDAKADGERPQKRTQKESNEARTADTVESYETAFRELESFSKGVPIMVSDMAEKRGTTEKAVTKWISENSKLTFLRYRKGVLFMEVPFLEPTSKVPQGSKNGTSY